MGISCPSCGEANPDRARFCLGCAEPLPQPEPSDERKLATVLFADLVGSTAMADEQDPERTRQVLDRFYDAMTEEVERCGGTVEKFAGDAVMAAFGAPAALEDHAERTLHAAIAMQRRLGELFGGRLSLRIGVNTGEVVVGRAREGSSFVTGDAVNVAARLEQAASPGEIVAGERTVAAARGAFEFGEPATIQAKGKPDGVVSRRVLRALALMRPRGVRGLPSVFIGRDDEFEQLTALYDQVATTGLPHLVSILGEPGVGKTRLSRAIWDWLSERSPEPLRRTGHTLSYGEGATYWPMGEVLKEHFGISENDPPEAIATALAGWPHLGLTLGRDVDEGLHPLVARERLHDAWVGFLQDLVRERPGVVLIEDLHWAEDDMCDLLDTLVADVDGPLLVIATARPEILDRRPAWGGARHRTSAIHLDALPPTDTDRLLDALVGSDVPAPIRDLVLEHAGGNPFFVEELLGTLIDRGVLVRSDGGWAYGELPPGFDVPDSVQGVVAARIDLLPEAEKAALQAASVIGRIFWTGPVYELVPGDPPNLGLLEERDLVRRRTGSTLAGEREYVIKHALTREVAYASLPKARRARMHAAFASWLERRADVHDELAPLLAHHYAAAVRPDDLDLAWAGEPQQVDELRTRALTWSRKAAELAVARYEIDDGISLLRQAVELEPDPARQADLWFEIGHACALRYDGEGFVTAMERALELGAPAEQVYPELASQTVQRLGMWKQALDGDLVAAWVERAADVAPAGTRVRVRVLAAKAEWEQDLDAAREALALAEGLGDAELRSIGLGAVQALLGEAGRLADACALASTRDGLLAEIGDPDHLANALMLNGDLFECAGRLVDARTTVTRLERTVEGLTPHHRLHGMTSRLRLEVAVADWAVVRLLGPRTEEIVEANLATPCPGNVGALLLVALAFAHGNDHATHARLIAKAKGIGMVGYGAMHASRWLRLAIVGADREETRRIVEEIEPDWLTPDNAELWAALFDGLVLLGDRERIEEDAPRWIRPDAYVAPFAVRSLGMARGDSALLGDAVTRFESMGLSWHADETRRWKTGSSMGPAQS